MTITPGYTARIFQLVMSSGRHLADVLNRRSEHKDVVDRLYREGFIDPFEITPAVQDFTDLHLIALQRDLGRAPSDAEIAVRMMRLMITPPGTVTFEERNYPHFPGKEGGLCIHYNNSWDSALRKRFGEVLPTNLLTAPLKEREADCHSVSLLLAVCLRAAGISASVKINSISNLEDHWFVSADFNDSRYRLDPICSSGPKIVPVPCQGDSDSTVVSQFYALMGSNLVQQIEFKKAKEAIQMALVIDPTNPAARKLCRRFSHAVLRDKH